MNSSGPGSEFGSSVRFATPSDPGYHGSGQNRTTRSTRFTPAGSAAMNDTPQKNRRVWLGPAVLFVVGVAVVIGGYAYFRHRRQQAFNDDCVFLCRKIVMHLKKTEKPVYYCWLCAGKALEDGTAYTKHIVQAKRLGSAVSRRS